MQGFLFKFSVFMVYSNGDFDKATERKQFRKPFVLMILFVSYILGHIIGYSSYILTSLSLFMCFI